MQDESVPPTDHISRYCSGGQLDEDGWPDGSYFRLKPKDGGCLSVNWLEYLNIPNRRDQLNEIVRVHRSNKMTIRHTGVMAVMNVGELINHVSSERAIRVLHNPIDDPDAPDSSHACISGLELGDEIVCDLIAQNVTERYRISDLDAV